MDQMKDLEENMLTETAAPQEETGGTTQPPHSTDAEETKENRDSLKKEKKSFRFRSFLFEILFYFASLSACEILLRFFTKTGIPSFRTVLTFLAAALLMTAFLSGIRRLPGRWTGRAAVLLLLIFTGVFFATECMVYDSFQMYMTMKTILMGAGDVVSGYSNDFWHTILHGLPKIIVFFLPAIIYILCLARKKGFSGSGRKASLLLVLFSVIIAVHSSDTLLSSFGGEGGRYDYDTGVRQYGMMTGTWLSLRTSLSGDTDDPDFIDVESLSSEIESEEEVKYGKNEMKIDFRALADQEEDESIRALHEYALSQEPSSKNQYTGLFQGKNLILICAEAFSDHVVSEELTPTLYRLIHNGFYFSDYYQPAWGGSTISGEFSFLFGIAPYDRLESMKKTSSNNNYFTMGNQLQRLGYYSAAFHNGTSNYYDRDETHTNLGYDSFIAQNNGLEEIADAYPDDEKMFDRTMDTYLDQQPFSIYYMTVSGHASYVQNSVEVREHMDRVNEVLGDQYPDKVKYYICYQMELEDALTTMVGRLEEKGIANDTVIAMTTDHYPYGLERSSTFKSDRNYLPDLYQTDSMPYAWDRDKNGLIIWSGCLENKDSSLACEIPEPTFSLDILPTLSNLFGLEYDSRLLTGRDVFSDQEAIVFWNNGSWITEKGRYDVASGEFLPAEGEDGDEEYVERTSQIVRNRLSFSDQVVEHDYYRILFGEDTTGEHNS